MKQPVIATGVIQSHQGMQTILGDAKNIRKLLTGTKYAIDYYQREFRWQTKHISELIGDLIAAFEGSFDPDHDRRQVSKYNTYFLGSIIVSHRDNTRFIVDGQQRLTSITLLLVFLYHKLADANQRAILANMIYSSEFGVMSFNVDVDERTAVMKALYDEKTYDVVDAPESVVNILDRFQDIQREFPEELLNGPLPFFVDWLIERVFLVEITAASDRDAYTIFETMNDRGLSLTPTDMLKGYLLANITSPPDRIDASLVWKKRVADLQDIGSEEDADAIKAWLRSQRALSIRERKKGAVSKDFDLIGTEFHRWVRDNQESLGLNTSRDFLELITGEFDYYGRLYARIKQAADKLTPGLESVFYNAQNNFTLQYPLLMASICRDDPSSVVDAKLRIVSAFVDILITRRQWNWKSTSYAGMHYGVFLAMLEIRQAPIEKLVTILIKRLAEDGHSFEPSHTFGLHLMNGPQVHRILARMTDFVETRSGLPSRYEEFVTASGKNGYEVEHIWANHPEWYDEFDHPNSFNDARNRLGGLLILPKTFNASFGDLPYEKKREQYVKQNLLALSLHEKAWEHNPGFVRFVKESGLPFRPHPVFRNADQEQRQELYRQLAEMIWSTSRLTEQHEA